MTEIEEIDVVVSSEKSPIQIKEDILCLREFLIEDRDSLRKKEELTDKELEHLSVIENEIALIDLKLGLNKK